MALIGHRCKCGHNDINHTEDGDGKRLCTAGGSGSCKRRCKPVTDVMPELMPTFDLKGNAVERVIPPGDGLGLDGGHPIGRTCGCDACQALYEQLVPSA